MSIPRFDVASAGALGDAAALFQHEVDPHQQYAGAGYIDVLGEVDVVSPLRSHQVFRRKRFPSIYQRFWRPVVSRVAFGVFGMGARRERRITLEMLGIAAGDRIIDIGCGPGNYTRSLARENKGELVIGVDASEAMLAAAVKASAGQNIAFVRADACALPFENSGFDVVCSVGTIHMTKDPMSALREMVRMLAPGGRICIVATCGRTGAPRRVRNGVTFFARNELPDALAEHGVVEIEQRIVKRGQFVSGVWPGK